MEDDVYPIFLFNNPILKLKITEEVHCITDEHREVAEKMLRTMYRKGGVGLAANQVGVQYRVIVLYSSRGPLVMFNPFITQRLPKKIRSGEGCLSFPKLDIITERFKTILVRYRGVDNIVREEQFSDLDAKIVQHEIDHLNGIIFTERK